MILLPLVLTAPIAGAQSESGASLQSLNRAPFNTGYIYQFKTSVDGGGDVSSHFFHVRGQYPIVREEGRVIAVSAAYYLHDYDFSGGGPSSFGALDPWDDIHSFRVAMPIRWQLSDRWSFFGVPMIRSVGESGAKFSDALSGGGLAGVSYRFGDRLTMGPGFGYISQIEDDASVFPILLIKWQLAENLDLTTGPTVGATLGPGLSLNWQFADRWQFSVGTRYEKLRMRLDDGGVGEDRSVPLFGALSYQAGEHWRLALVGGVGFANELKLEDEGGKSILNRDYDPSPFVGVNAAFTF